MFHDHQSWAFANICDEIRRPHKRVSLGHCEYSNVHSVCCAWSVLEAVWYHLHYECVQVSREPLWDFYANTKIIIVLRRYPRRDGTKLRWMQSNLRSAFHRFSVRIHLWQTRSCSWYKLHRTCTFIKAVEDPGFLSDFAQGCLHSIDQNSEHLLDEYLIQLVKLESVAEEITQALPRHREGVQDNLCLVVTNALYSGRSLQIVQLRKPRLVTKPCPWYIGSSLLWSKASSHSWRSYRLGRIGMAVAKMGFFSSLYRSWERIKRYSEKDERLFWARTAR